MPRKSRLREIQIERSMCDLETLIRFLQRDVKNDEQRWWTLEQIAREIDSLRYYEPDGKIDVPDEIMAELILEGYLE